MNNNHENKHYLIFGASASIGISLVEQLLLEGAILTVQGDRFVSEIPPCHQTIAFHFTPDNTKEFIKQTSPKIMFDGLIFLLGKTDFTFFSKMSKDTWESTLFNNLTLPALLTREFYSRLNEDASIVFISSALADIGAEGMTHYAAAKAGLEGLTRSLAKELSNRKIRVNCISPHLIETRNTQKMSKKHLAKFINNTLLKRSGRPIDVANAIKFLLSGEASFITGQIIKLNGGSYFVN